MDNSQTAHSYDQMMLDNENITFIFAAGNSGDIPEYNGYYTLFAPGACKNSLTVGALNQITVSNRKNDIAERIFIVNQITARMMIVAPEVLE